MAGLCFSKSAHNKARFSAEIIDLIFTKYCVKPRLLKVVFEKTCWGSIGFVPSSPPTGVDPENWLVIDDVFREQQWNEVLVAEGLHTNK